MKKGFTIIEILGVIVIMVIIIMIAIPTYKGVSTKIKENVYESKVKELLAKGESYAEETGNLAFNVDTLIKKGKLSPDNETGIYKDPRSNRKMNCDIIEITWEDNHYIGNLIESNECLSEEELNNRYGMVELKIVDEENNIIPKIEGTEWLNSGNVFVTYEWKEAYKNLEPFIESITWNGEKEDICNKENLSSCKKYAVSTDSTKMVTVNLKLTVTINLNGNNTKSNYSQNVYLDVVAPEIKTGSIILNNEYNTNNERKVNFEITDYNGSGVKEYALVKEKTCNGVEYNTNKKSAIEGVQTEYLANGTYYICVTDKVGNKTEDTNLDKDSNKIEVSNVDNNIPSVSLNIQSKDTRYHTKDVNLTITASDDEGVSNLKMCISNEGYLQNCSWEAYTNTKAWSLSGEYDGGIRTVYITIQDTAGNISQNSSTYTIYKNCTTLTDWQEISNTKSNCPKCGNANYTINYNKLDSYLGTTCQNKTENKSCGLKACGPSVTYAGPGKSFNLVIPVNDTTAIGFNAGTFDSAWSARECTKGYCKQSYVDATIIKKNADGSITYGNQTRILSGNNGLGQNIGDPLFGARMSDDSVVILGVNSMYYASKYYVGQVGAAIVRVNGMSPNVTSFTTFAQESNSLKIDSFACNGTYCKYYMEGHGQTSTQFRTFIGEVNVNGYSVSGRSRIAEDWIKVTDYYHGDIENRAHYTAAGGNDAWGTYWVSNLGDNIPVRSYYYQQFRQSYVGFSINNTQMSGVNWNAYQEGYYCRLTDNNFITKVIQRQKVGNKTYVYTTHYYFYKYNNGSVTQLYDITRSGNNLGNMVHIGDSCYDISSSQTLRISLS